MENQQITSNLIDSGLIHSIVITSDPQYPWTPCTDKKNCTSSYGLFTPNKQSCQNCPTVSTCSDNDKDSENLIKEQYNSINAYANSVGKDKVSMIINGDMTYYGHGSNWSGIFKFLKTLQVPYYYGLGNHDMLNNQKRNSSEGCANDGCFRDSIYHVYKDQPNVPSISSYDVDPSYASLTGYSGSFSYEFNCGDVYCIQLNNFPTMPTHYSDNSKLKFTTENIIPWLQRKLDKVKGPVIINLHEPDDDWRDRSDGVSNSVMNEAKRKFIEFINQYDNIIAVFAGHYHYTTGKYPSSFKAPMFLSGSAMFKSYLILEQYNNRLEIFLVCGNDWKNKSLIYTINIKPISNREDIPAIPEMSCRNNRILLWGTSTGPIATEAHMDFNIGDQYIFHLNGKVVPVQQKNNGLSGLVFTGKFNEIILTRDNCPRGDLWSFTGGYILYDNTTEQSFITLTDLENVTQQVYALFTSSSYTELTSSVSNYQINQVAIKVNALSTEIFGKEKATLRKLVNKAKQFMRTRNLLVGGEFETLDKWLLGDRATVANNSTLFKENYLFLSANDTPDILSYAYQKVDESKLKPYTRYKVSGFIGESKNLEISIYRYGNELNKTLNISHPDTFQFFSDSNPDCCRSSPSCYSNQHDSHFFSYNIDVGELYPELNPGIELNLRIIPSNGFATIGNLEIVEERPLTEKEIQKIQRKEPKWKIAFEKERAEVSALLQPITDRINSFFKDANWNSEILPHVTYQDLYDVVLPEFPPKLRQWIKEDSKGKHYMIFEPLKEALERVHVHLEEQNLIHNGSFAYGLEDWLVEGNAQLTTLDNENRVLQIQNWDSSVLQSIDILEFDETKEYQLVIRAKGEGTVTIEHGEEVEIIAFLSKFGFDFYKTKPFSFETASFILRLQSEGSEFIVDHVAIIEVPEEDE